MLLDLGASFKRLHAALRHSPLAPSSALPTPPDHPCPLLHPLAPLPEWVAHDPLVQKYRALLGSLPWAD